MSVYFNLQTFVGYTCFSQHCQKRSYGIDPLRDESAIFYFPYIAITRYLCQLVLNETFT